MPDHAPIELSEARVFDCVSSLCELAGPTGREEAVRAYLVDTWTPLVENVATEAVGNLLARVGGSGPRILIQAHMDEIGFVVTQITDDGFLFVSSAQSGPREPLERRYVVGQPATVLGRDGVVASGVFAAPSGHVLTQDQLDQPRLRACDFFVDVGVDDRTAVEALGIHIGAAVIWDAPTRRVGSKLVGKAMDDRLLLAVITLLLDQLDHGALAVELWVAATVQEENSLRGSTALAASERFDGVIALDVGLCGDVPGVDRRLVDTKLGAGPIIVHRDGTTHYDHRLTWALVDAAIRAEIPFQHGTFGDYGSDGSAFQGAGSPSALVTTPVRYTHTAIEMAATSDVVATVELLHAYALDPDPRGT